MRFFLNWRFLFGPPPPPIITLGHVCLHRRKESFTFKVENWLNDLCWLKCRLKLFIVQHDTFQISSIFVLDILFFGYLVLTKFSGGSGFKLTTFNFAFKLDILRGLKCWLIIQCKDIFLFVIEFLTMHLFV